MHCQNRRSKPSTGTHLNRRRRGFTLIELGVAVLVFSLVAGVVTLAIARSQLSGVQDRIERGVRGELTRLVAIAASGAREDLLAGTFTRPDACPSAATLSCVEVLEREYRVTWTVTETTEGVTVVAVADLPDGSSSTARSFIATTVAEPAESLILGEP